ncbi:OLC1v1022987C3 [Oldenlandia corymbosa var. corymbosa]|uniref:OLC1v1022987C3 n=1 Tax=Oldenlandia corymbosa var. corymbosa TaxID=529605 RepID=A0AAV1C2M8_OLDCO|nr:OLC1v1022987C3 [Oldenlandia corymbosa var. corymbosa]
MALSRLVPSPGGLPYILGRLCLHWKVSCKGYVSYTLCEAKQTLSEAGRSKRIIRFSTSHVVSNHAHIAWKRFAQTCSFTTVLPPVSRIACAVSLALTRSKLVAPGILAFVIRELTWRKTLMAEAEGFPTRDTLYMHAQNGNIQLTSFVFLLLEGLILFLRAIYLAVLFCPCIAMAPFAESLGSEYRTTWLQTVRVTLEKAGPAFIKWGQWAATRPDLFPSDLCSELAKLHMKAPAHSYAYTKTTIESAFRRKLHEIFETFEEEPVASGSIAQIHRATLKFRYPGKQIKPILVAVKVRHPGVGEAIRRDFTLINIFAKIAAFFPTLQWLRLDESIQQFAVFMMSQVDLAREAANLNRFLYNFRRWKDVSFPKPLYPLVHPAVLVETYEHGESVQYYVDKLDGHQDVKSGLAHLGTHALLKMLLLDNFLHADMHPGNILVRTTRGNASAKGLFKLRPHLIFIDVGMTAELSVNDRVTLLEFFKAVALRDGRTAAECTLKLSKHQSCPNPESFIQEVENTFNFWDTEEGGSFHPADCMQQMLEQVRRHRVNIDGNVCTVMVTMLVLEGWQRKLDPEYDVLRTLQTLLFKADWAESLVYTIEGLMAP